MSYLNCLRVLKTGTVTITVWMLICNFPSRDSMALQDIPSSSKTSEVQETSGSLLQVHAGKMVEDHAIEQRIAGTFQKIGKNLILEQTRGEKEAEIYRKASPAVVMVLTKEGFGSGALLDRKGYVITNAHVAGGYSEVVVVFKPKDGEELTKDLAYVALVVKVDEVVDLALLKIVAPPASFSTLSLGDFAALKVGLDVHAIGHPEGEVWTYTKGIISQIRGAYEWSGPSGIQHRAKVIQTQTPINPGNSGGPLLNDDGDLVGINSFYNPQAIGLNYAIAVDTIKEFLLRPDNRQASTSQTGNDLRCVEKYDGVRKGWGYIVGCYIGLTTTPPNIWYVAKNSNSPPDYGAAAAGHESQIDTVMITEKPPGKGIIYAYDNDCNGSVDLLGHQPQDSQTITSYRAAPPGLTMTNLVSHLDKAIKSRAIRYAGVRVCQ